MQATRRGRGRGNRSRGKVNVRRDDTMKFEEDFDFETANAQFHKDDIDKELQNKLKLKGKLSTWNLVKSNNYVVHKLHKKIIIIIITVTLNKMKVSADY